MPAVQPGCLQALEVLVPTRPPPRPVVKYRLLLLEVVGIQLVQISGLEWYQLATMEHGSHFLSDARGYVNLEGVLGDLFLDF